MPKKARALFAGTVFDSPTSSLDIHATALAVAGVTGSAAGKIEGVDLIPLLAKKVAAVADRTLYWRVWSGWDYALREGSYKLVKPDWSKDAMLFDLSRDITEHHDLSAERPEVKARLMEKWKQWNADNVPQRWNDDHRENVAREYAAGLLN